MNMKIQHIGIADSMSEADPESFPAITTEPTRKALIVSYETDECKFDIAIEFHALENTIADLVHVYGIKPECILISIAPIK